MLLAPYDFDSVMPAHRSGDTIPAYSSQRDERDDDKENLYELSDVTAASSRLPGIMPASLHRALNAYPRRTASTSEDSDSDDDTGEFANGHIGAKERSIEALLRKKAREGIEDDDDERDLERQKPAWAASSSAESNIIKVCKGIVLYRWSSLMRPFTIWAICGA